MDDPHMASGTVTRWEGMAPLHGFLRGSVHGAEAVDLTAPVLDAADGLLHG
jgi:hypothetical protein